MSYSIDDVANEILAKYSRSGDGEYPLELAPAFGLDTRDKILISHNIRAKIGENKRITFIEKQNGYRVKIC